MDRAPKGHSRRAAGLRTISVVAIVVGVMISSVTGGLGVSAAGAAQGSVLKARVTAPAIRPPKQKPQPLNPLSPKAIRLERARHFGHGTTTSPTLHGAAPLTGPR